MTDKKPDKKEPEWSPAQGDYEWVKDPQTGEQVKDFLGYQKTWGE